MDTELSSECLPWVFASGKTRCVPDVGLTVEYYSDDQCTKPVGSSIGYLVASAKSGRCEPLSRVYKAGTPYKGPFFHHQLSYQDGVARQGACTKMTFDSDPGFSTLVEVPEATFAELTLSQPKP
jgi:hypothetical protein